MPVRINAKIYHINHPENIYVQIYENDLKLALDTLDHAKEVFAVNNKIKLEDIDVFIFGDSDSKKLQLQINELRDQVGVLFDMLKAMREYGYGNQRHEMRI